MVLGACGPDPACVDDGDGRAFPSASCGEAGPDVPLVFQDEMVIIAACTGDWSVRCEPGGERVMLRGGRWPTCFHGEVGGPVMCDSGEAPHCIAIPCDGETYYGPAHPMAGE